MTTNRYPPIEAYGIVGNGETCALVDPDGTVGWHPVPHVESPSVFAAVLDADRGGHFRIGPAGPSTRDRAYVPRTNVLKTGFDTDTGAASLTDFMPPTEAGVGGPTRALYRKFECTSGTVELEADFAPRHEYGRAETSVRTADGTVVAEGGDQRLTLSSEVPLRTRAATRAATATARIEADEARWFVLDHGDGWAPDADGCERVLQATVSYWRDWAHDHDGSADDECVFEGPWHDDVVRSGLVLKLLAHAETGAIAAAPTTSLPEEIGGVRNWDYRYSWPRDAAFTVQALAHLGYLREAGAYFDWFLDLCRMPPGEIKPLYGLHGEVDLEERELPHLEGYRGSSPVRVGNAAVEQRQIDVYGELVLALSVAVHHGWELREADWAAYRDVVDYVVDVWEQPDSGIWEVRSRPEHFVHSKAMCWVALDRGIAMAEESGWPAPLDRWRGVRERVRAEILERGYDEERNTFTRTYGGDALDATALLLPIVGFLPFDDDRIEGTLAAVRRGLETEAGFVRRYDGEDGLPGDEGTFTLCSFWLVDVLALSGRLEEARERFLELLSYASPLGLLAEEIDPAGEDGLHRGNYPQAFSHVGLINSALYLGRLADPERPGPDPVGIWLGEGPAIPD